MTVDRYQVAQVNIGITVEPLTSARLASLVDLLDPVNALADASPGFVWRLQTEDGDATAVKGFDDDRIIVNMSVWETPEHLAAFVFGGFHAEVLRRRREWFSRMREQYAAVWWVPAGTVPSVADAEERLAALRRDGPTPAAFTLRRPFPPPADRTDAPTDPRPDDDARLTTGDRAGAGWAGAGRIGAG